MLSVIVPAYNEEGMIPKCAGVIKKLLEKENIDFELLFVNDGSIDESWVEIKKQTDKDARIKGIKFSRNFGKESAMFAGLSESRGDCVCVIDCDLQHPPEKIVEMYRLWEDGYEVVEGVKSDRGKESIFHAIAAKTFYKAISEAAGVDMTRASDFKLLDRKAVNVLLNMPEKNAFFRALSSWVGFKSIQIPYEVREREEGKSKWSTRSLTKYALTNIASFTSAPMQIVTILGIIMISRKTNKALVKYLMDRKGIEAITITEDKVLLTVTEKFTPQDGERLVRDIGHSRFKPVSRNGKNYLILERF